MSKCDICSNCEENPKNWHSMAHRHNAWGNDSIDSYETFDVCSPHCYFKQLEKSVKEIGDSWGGEVLGDISIAFAKRLTDYVNSLKIKDN